jgi:hypothetical protein
MTIRVRSGRQASATMRESESDSKRNENEINTEKPSHRIGVAVLKILHVSKMKCCL